jgi:hypothetical protein
MNWWHTASELALPKSRLFIELAVSPRNPFESASFERDIATIIAGYRASEIQVSN